MILRKKQIKECESETSEAESEVRKVRGIKKEDLEETLKEFFLLKRYEKGRAGLKNAQMA